MVKPLRRARATLGFLATAITAAALWLAAGAVGQTRDAAEARQTKQTAPGAGPAHASPDPAVRVTELAWLAGNWKGAFDQGPTCEEIWSAPAGGSIMGMFRLFKGEQPTLWEFLLIEPEAEGAVLRFHHFLPGYKRMEEQPLAFRLTEASDKHAVLSNLGKDGPREIRYELKTPRELLITLESRESGEAPQRIIMKKTGG